MSRLGRIATTFARVVVATMLAASAYWKFADPGAFLESVVEYQLVPFVVALVVASWLPWLEAVVALMLLTACHRGAAVVAILLGLVFVVAQSSVLVRGLSVSCGCFGPSSEPVGVVSLIRSILFLVFAWLTLQSRHRSAEADNRK